ncbi:unnamed protein product [Victoria cruziana]
MRALGRLRRPNVLPLLAYYYRREEKMLVYDCVENGSLAYFLHEFQGIVTSEIGNSRPSEVAAKPDPDTERSSGFSGPIVGLSDPQNNAKDSVALVLNPSTS